MLSYFGCLEKPCPDQGSKLKGVQDSCFQVRFGFFCWEIRGNGSVLGFGNATFIVKSRWIHDLKALCGATKALVPMVWPGRLKEMGWEHDGNMAGPAMLSYFIGVYIDTNE